MTTVKETTEVIGSFGKQVLARLTGQDDKAKAIKIERQCRNKIQRQIKAIDCELDDVLDEKEKAEEALQNAIYPSDTPDNNYVSGIERANKRLQEVLDRIEDLRYSQVLLQDILDK